MNVGICAHVFLLDIMAAKLEGLSTASLISLFLDAFDALRLYPDLMLLTGDMAPSFTIYVIYV